jgi:hypothetical protein
MISASTFIHEHTERQRPVHGGSTSSHRGNLKRNLEGDHYRLYGDYFHSTIQFIQSTYSGIDHFWMPRKLLLTILEGARDYASYFRCNPDAVVRMLAYGVAGDLVDEHV